MKKILFIALLLSGLSVKSQVGINTDSPTKMLDVNGDLRIRMLPQGNNSQSLLITDSNGNMLKMDVPEMLPSKGDIKDTYYAGDHDGWYLLDGRNINSLPANAQATAVSLGFTSTLPDFAGKYAKATSGEALSSVGGNPSYNITKQNMPSFSFSGNTSAAGSHNHYANDRTPHGGGTIWGYTTGGTVNWWTYTIRTTSAAGAHSHTLSLNSNGSGQAIPLAPAFIAVNTFVYLGL
ncbi:hypothetical protein [Chryseobacterium sp. sg2396]|uniref:hypothetical protein n=1 Tax=Chryseobacterium sp. sg2396 TaxID=3276280 RepID=UPI003672110D